MNENDKQIILKKAKVFFKEKIALQHAKNTEKLKDISEFNVNPFLNTYLANFAFGDNTPENLARALVYPRILGTSITTSFGTNVQQFCTEVFEGFASVVPGIDIEFIDSEDGHRKYCQVKAGPNTINRDGVKNIIGHFKDIKNLARTNGNREINPARDCVVGVLYGEFFELSSHYLSIHEEHPVYCGQNFWYHLTGDREFYRELCEAFAEVAVEIDGRNLIEKTVAKLAEQIRVQQKNEEWKLE